MTAFEFEKARAIWSAKMGGGEAAFFESLEYQLALLTDLAALPANPTAEDDFFKRHSVPQQLLVRGAHHESIVAWEHCLTSIRSTASARYDSMHKGTPYYFIGAAAYLIEDFEKAFFYMDCAVAEDRHVHGANWRNTPAGYFIRLDDSNPNQFARVLTSRTKRAVDNALQIIASRGAVNLSLQRLHDKLLAPAIDGPDELRSAVTALFTFILEYQSRRRDLMCASSHGGSGEPFLLHLFKGALIFETLLKVSALGQKLGLGTLGDYLCNSNIQTSLGLARGFGGMGNISFDEVIEKVREAEVRGGQFNERAVQAAWGVRNTTGHSLAWKKRPTPDEYEMLFNHLLAAIVLVVDRLF
jgi:hypothetical protein